MARTLFQTTLIVLLPLAALAAPPAMTPAPPPRAIAVNGDAALPEMLAGVWIVTGVDAATIPPGAPVTLDFGAAGELVGTSGCNRYGAALTISGASLTVGPVRATRMACSADLMALEAAFNTALAGITRYEIAADGTLALYGDDTLLMQAARE